jgi:hypothetical protein
MFQSVFFQWVTWHFTRTTVPAGNNASPENLRGASVEIRQQRRPAKRKNSGLLENLFLMYNHFLYIHFANGGL